MTNKITQIGSVKWDEWIFENEDHKIWYKENLIHRLDGPAIEWSCGDKEWYQNAELHRLDGPAQIFKNGEIGYYLNGEHYNENDFGKKLKS